MLHDIDRIVASLGPLSYPPTQPISYSFSLHHLYKRGSTSTFVSYGKKQVTRMSVIIRKKESTGPFTSSAYHEPAPAGRATRFFSKPAFLELVVVCAPGGRKQLHV